VTEPRELRGLVPVEIVAVLACAIAPLPDVVPVALPLLVVATASRWIRGRSWAEVARGRGAAIGFGVGIAAVAIAVVLGTPVIEATSGRAVEWSQHPIVRGNTSLMVMVILHAGVAALAAELALRGWIVERVLELSPGPPVLPVLVGAFAEAIVSPGDIAARIGAGVFGIGLGWMYVAGGRSVVAPICARVAFAVGVVVLESLRVVG
jgi:hypothetical protein